jgi:hypothetical protein
VLQTPRLFLAFGGHGALLPASESGDGSGAVLCDPAEFSRDPVGEGHVDLEAVDFHRAQEVQEAAISCRQATGNPAKLRVSTAIRAQACAG